jgi:tubulin polyglutamylase TTLL6/13
MPLQRINHFHGMLALCRKAAMARLLTAMAAAAPPGAYAFAPPAWLLPAQLPALLADAKSRGRQQTYIIKPDAGCQGRGIALVQGGPRTTLLKALAGLPPAVAAPAVAQHYLSNPALIGGHKYDLRLYVLVAGVDPLR